LGTSETPTIGAGLPTNTPISTPSSLTPIGILTPYPTYTHYPTYTPPQQVPPHTATSRT
jgi:hypothetical protein